MTSVSIRRSGRWLNLALVSGLLLGLAGCGKGGSAPPGGGEGGMPAPEVAVAVATTGDVPTLLEYTGRAAGSREVEVRARVDGILLQRRYEEGSAVKQGDVLFRIDPEPYRAAAAQARAELGVAKAQLDEARRQHDRVVPLFEKNAASRKQRDEAVSQYEVAQANLEAARARLHTAELDLGYTEVRAPISGLTSREARSEGSLVTANSDTSLLTRIVQTDPVYVEFSVPEGDAVRMRATARRNGQDLSVVLVGDGTDATAAAPRDGGRLSFVDTSVEQGSGTVRARAVFPNADHRLVPGQFVRVRVEGIVAQSVTSVPRRAVMSSAQGTFVWVVDAKHTVQLRPVKLAGDSGDRALVAEGLANGESVVVEGVLKVRPGVQVKIAPDAPPPGATPAAKPEGAGAAR